MTPTYHFNLDYAAHDSSPQPLDDIVKVRKAKIGLEGEVADNWHLKIGYDFTDTAAKGGFRDGVSDVKITYMGWDKADIIVGHFKVPMSMERSTGSGDVLFAERALATDALTLSRRLGVGLARTRQSYTLAAMAFGPSIDGKKGHGFGVHGTIVPWRHGDTLLHLGGSFVMENPGDDVSFGAVPESKVTDYKFVKTNAIANVRRIDRYGLEAALQSGPWLAEAEWLRLSLTRGMGLPNADMTGYYIAGSRILVGGKRPYKGGTFGAPTFTGGPGTVEIAARYSRINLNSHDVSGGKERNYTLGLNYYPVKPLRISANFINAHSTRLTSVNRAKIFLLRAQFKM